MNVEVIATSNFQRQAKKLMRKYPSLRIELEGLATELADNPKKGSSLGSGCF